MSSETADFTVTTHTRNNPAHYWAFFTTEDGAFWQFVDRNRADLKPQAAAPQHSEQAQETLRTPKSAAKRYTPFSIGLGENCLLKHA